MAQQAFRAAPPCLLLESGALADASGAEARWRRGSTLVLSRALCRFRLFRAAPGLPTSQRIRAARLFAEANAPFESTGIVLSRAPQGAAIWYWDKAQAARLLQVEPEVLRDVVPEAYYRADGAGWRILECVEGYEAQYWEAGSLAASTWRRTAFSREQWAAFALSVEVAATPAPDAPPAPQQSALARNETWWRNRIRDPWSWRDAENAAVAVALCGLGAAAVFTGQALHLDAMARADADKIAAIEERALGTPDVRRLRERLALIADYNEATTSADVMGAAADAFEVFERLGLQIDRWSVTQDQMTIGLAAPGNQAPLRDLIAALQAKPRLGPVTPKFGADGSAELVIDLAPAPGDAS